jgi:acetoin utilization deacetylase AcuC-like enzyme
MPASMPFSFIEGGFFCMSIAIISHPDCLLHDMNHHPEAADRIEVIANALSDASFHSKLINYSAPLVTEEQLLRVHTKKYIDYIIRTSPTHGYVSLDPDTWMNPHTLTAAFRAAGAAVLAVDKVMSGEVSAAFCNVRPPGHHAERARPMGFCFFNNVAVGVAHAMAVHNLERVAIIDFDVHHGNGTQDIFYNDDNVLFCSSFQHPFYPYSGAGVTPKHIINILLPAGSDGKYFREQVMEHWLRHLLEFRPEMIFFSAGFDAHVREKLANLGFIEEDYAWITQEVKRVADVVCGGRMVSVLEGGYNLHVIGHCAVEHVGGMF